MIKNTSTKKYKSKNQQLKITKKLQRNKQKSQEMKYQYKIRLCQYQEKFKLLKHSVKNQFMNKDKDVWSNLDRNLPQLLQKCSQEFSNH